MEFETLGLNNELLRGIEKLGFDQPTPIQEKVIPLLLANDTDLVGLAQTGTGKTGAFGLPLIHRLDLNRKVTQGIILCPTRELCVQITSDLKEFGVGLPSLNIAAVYGGAAILPQMRQLKVGAQIVVATPGRLLDLMNRGVLDTAGIRQVVLDEADEMLNMGFQEDIERIFAGLPVKRHIWLFSATMPPAVSAVARK
jgi:ATP-dependent RNA helicase DeaD